MEYSYKISNLSRHDAFLQKIKAVSGIEKASLTDDILTVTIKSGYYEYDVLTDIFKVCDSFSATLDFNDENGDNGTIDGDLVEKEEENPQSDNEASDGVQLSTDPKKQEGAKVVDDYDDVNILEKEKKQLRSDIIFRIGELSISLILFIISLFLKPGSGITFHTIILVFAFSIAGYDVVYGVFTDIVKKKPLNGNLVALLSAVSAVILGHAAFGALFIILFSTARSVSVFSERYKDFVILKSYYTGSLPVEVGGVRTKLEDLKPGDTADLVEGDYVPCDGVAAEDGTVMMSAAGPAVQTEIFCGDKVFAGSVVLSEGLKVTISTLYGQSVIDKQKEDFISKKEERLSAKCNQKVAKIGLYADILGIILSLLVTFFIPVFSTSYSIGLEKWAVVGGAILGIFSVSGVISFALNTYDNLTVAGMQRGILFGDRRAVADLAAGNQLVVDANVLVENGALKEDTYGMLNEFLGCGVDNVTVDFSKGQFSESVMADLDFKQEAVKNPKNIYVGEGGDVSLSGGKNEVLNGQISFIPLAYKMAKNANKAAKVGAWLSISIKIAAIALIFAFPGISPFVFCSIAGLGEAICSAVSLLGFRKIN